MNAGSISNERCPCHMFLKRGRMVKIKTHNHNHVDPEAFINQSHSQLLYKHYANPATKQQCRETDSPV